MISARASATRLIMPPDRSDGILSASSGFRPTICSLTIAASRTSVGGSVLQLAQREGDVLQHAEGREQRAVLEQHADAAGRARRGPSRATGWPSTLDLARGRLLQAQDLAQQHGLAGARAAHQRHHLAALHGEVQVLVHHEARSGVVNTVHSLRMSTIGAPAAGTWVSAASCHQIPTSLNSDGEQRVHQDHHRDRGHHRGRRALAQALRVGLRRAGRSGSRSARSACRTPPTCRWPAPGCRRCTASGSALRKKVGVMPSEMSAASMPPARAHSVVQTLISGIAIASAIARGITSRKLCEMPITRIASSSSVTRITPICAVIAEPERPGDQDGGQHRPQLADQRDAQDVDDVGVGAELPQLLRREVGQHHADQEADQRGDRQRRGADAVQVAREVAPRALRAARAPAAPRFSASWPIRRTNDLQVVAAPCSTPSPSAR